MTLSIGTYTVRKDKRYQVYRIYLKAGEGKMVYVSRHESSEEAMDEVARLQNGEELQAAAEAETIEAVR